MSDVSSIVSAMDRKGIKLSLQNDQLRYRAPKGLLTPQDIELLRSFKNEIVEFLRKLASPSIQRPPLTPRTTSGLVPLAWNQKWWITITKPQGMAGRISYQEIRLCSQAARYKGKLDIECLRRSLTELIRRHESLRTEIRTDGDTQGMEVCAPQGCNLEMIDLTAMDAAAVEEEAKRLVDEAIYDLPGPTLITRLLKLANDHHVLVIAMGHILSDRSSIIIMFRDLMALYAQALQGRNFALPQLPIQYVDYIDWQHRSSPWWHMHCGAYWEGRLRGAVAARYPVDETVAKTARFRFIQVQTWFDGSLTAGLRDVAHVAASTLPMVVLSVYTALLMSWRRQDDLLLKFVVHGRDRPELSNLVGFFSDTVHLRIKLRETDSFLDLVRTATTEYYLALDNYDFGRVGSSLTAADSDLALTAAVNWITLPQMQAGASRVGSPHPFAAPAGGLAMEPFHCTPLRTYTNARNFDYDPALKPYEPWLHTGESAGGIFGSLTYRTDKNEPASIERLLRNFHLFVERFARQPEIRVSEMHYSP